MSPPRHSNEVIEKKDKLLKLSITEQPLTSDVEDGHMTRDDHAVIEKHGIISNRQPTIFNMEALKSEAGANSGIDEMEKGSTDVTQRLEGAQDSSVIEGSLTTSLPSNDSIQPPADEMESSTVTLKPEFVQSPMTPIIENSYLDPTPKTPMASLPVSRSSSNAASIPLSVKSMKIEIPERSPTRSESGFDGRPSMSEDERENDRRSEIQSIMDQFSEEGGGPGLEEVMSPRLEVAGPLLGSSIQHPPRKSSLEPLNAHSVEDLHVGLNSPQTPTVNENGPAVPPKPGLTHSFNPSRAPDDRSSVREGSITSHGPSLHRPPPPDPEPEPDLPFDFHRFLEQLRHKTADPVAKFLRSFLSEFGKKQWMVHEQVKIIGDFLAFITNKMAQCEVWREVSDSEFDNAREGMEKLVMNRLYTQTFSPAIPSPQPIPGSRSKRKSLERPMGPGRRGQHQEDVERDDVLAQKVSIYGWVKEEHLEIEPVGDSGKRFLILAQQELLKIKTYRAPRDKIICVLNCCKVIFGLLKHSKSDSSADSFMPLLIYVVLQANPEHLVSNVQYILRFRNQDKLGGEAGYYLSSLMGAVQFIENLDRTTLTISDEDFEHNVEAAVSAIAEKHQAEEPVPPPASEKPSLSRPEPSSQRPAYVDVSTARKSTSSHEIDGDGVDEKAAMTGLLRTIQRPLTSIGRIFSDDGGPSHTGPARTPLPGNIPRMSPAPRSSSDGARSPQKSTPSADNNRNLHDAEEAAARQASAEAAEAHRLRRAEHANIVETLAGMFPDLDREVISDVVTQKNGRVGLAVDACLALSS